MVFGLVHLLQHQEKEKPYDNLSTQPSLDSKETTLVGQNESLCM